MPGPTGGGAVVDGVLSKLEGDDVLDKRILPGVLIASLVDPVFGDHKGTGADVFFAVFVGGGNVDKIDAVASLDGGLEVALADIGQGIAVDEDFVDVVVVADIAAKGYLVAGRVVDHLAVDGIDAVDVGAGGIDHKFELFTQLLVVQGRFVDVDGHRVGAVFIKHEAIITEDFAFEVVGVDVEVEFDGRNGIAVLVGDVGADGDDLAGAVDILIGRRVGLNIVGQARRDFDGVADRLCRPVDVAAKGENTGGANRRRQHLVVDDDIRGTDVGDQFVVGIGDFIAEFVKGAAGGVDGIAGTHRKLVEFGDGGRHIAGFDGQLRGILVGVADVRILAGQFGASGPLGDELAVVFDEGIIGIQQNFFAIEEFLVDIDGVAVGIEVVAGDIDDIAGGDGRRTESSIDAGDDIGRRRTLRSVVLLIFSIVLVRRRTGGVVGATAGSEGDDGDGDDGTGQQTVGSGRRCRRQQAT